MDTENKRESVLDKLSQRKTLIELVVAALTIPVLITVILLNYSDIRGKDNGNGNSTPIVIEKENSSPAPNPADQNSQIATPNPETCTNQVGPISISSPQEGSVVTENPVNFIIRYIDPAYCSVVWSYRINSGSWSEFSSNAPTIYNMPQGPVKFELRIQSTTSNDQELLTRNFTYGNLNPSPSPSPQAE